MRLSSVKLLLYYCAWAAVPVVTTRTITHTAHTTNGVISSETELKLLDLCGHCLNTLSI